jgi:hypothetical protein
LEKTGRELRNEFLPGPWVELLSNALSTKTLSESGADTLANVEKGPVA